MGKNDTVDGTCVLRKWLILILCSQRRRKTSDRRCRQETLVGLVIGNRSWDCGERVYQETFGYTPTFKRYYVMSSPLLVGHYKILSLHFWIVLLICFTTTIILIFVITDCKYLGYDGSSVSEYLSSSEILLRYSFHDNNKGRIITPLTMYLCKSLNGL